MAVYQSSLQGKVSATGAPETAENMRKVGDAAEVMGRKVRGAAADANASQGSWSRFKEDFRSGFNFSAGLATFDLIKDGLTSIGSLAMDAAVSYESSMNLLEVSTNASATEMAALAEKAKGLGADLSLPATSAGGAAQAMLELSRAGMSTQESMDAAKGTIQLAATEMMSEAEAAQITAGALNTFNLRATESVRVADLLAAGSNASSASVRDLASGVQQAGFAFAANNQNVDDLVTSVAALTNVGLTGSDSGTALKNAMLKLAAPTAEAANLMQQLGFNAFDANGKMKPMEQLINELNGSLAGMTDQQRNAALNTIFLSDGMKAMIPLLSLGGDGFANLRTKVQEHGAAGKLAEAQTKGFKGAMDGLKSSLETLAVEGLTPILPLVSDLIRGVSAILGPVGQAAGFIGNNLPTAFAVAATAIVGYTVVTNAAAIATAGGIIPALVNAAVAAKASAVAFAAAAFPLIALASMAISVGAVVYAIDQYTDRLKEQNEEILKSRDAYVEAQAALDQYEQSKDQYQGNTAIEQEIEKLNQLKVKYEELMGRATGTGGFWDSVKSAFDSDDVTQRQVAELKDLEAQMGATRQQLENLKGSHERSGAAMQGVITDYNNLEAAADGYTVSFADSFQVTEEAASAAEKTLEQLSTAGPKAFSDVINTAVSFMTERETAQATHNARLAELRTQGNQDAINKENEAFRTQERTAAESYAIQQAAQRAHLGTMLIDWVNAQAMINPAMAEKSGELVQMLAGQYGLVADAGQIAWGSNLIAIQGYVDGSIPSLDELSGKLNENEQAAIANSEAAKKLQAKYVTEIQQKWETGGFGTGPEAAAAYRRALEGVPSRVYTEMQADAANAVAQAQKAEDQYQRVERNLNTEITADNSQSVASSLAAAKAIRDIPDDHTTTATFVAGGAIAQAQAVGSQMSDGVAAGVAARASAIAASMRGAILGAIAAARAAAAIASPSRKAADDIGQHLPAGVAIGIEEASSLPRRAMQSMMSSLVDGQASTKTAMQDMGAGTTQSLATGIISAESSATNAAQVIGAAVMGGIGVGMTENGTVPRDKLNETVADVAVAYGEFTSGMEDLNREHAGELEQIWTEYYAKLKAENDQFNGDKFDQQLGFYETIANLDSESRNRAYEEQRAAWDASQQLALEKGGAIADQWYEASLDIIEADEQRAQRIIGIEEDIADKRRAIAEASSEEEKQRLAAEIAELESRKQFLEDVDRQQDARDQENLDAIKNQDSAIAAERDKALADENKDYAEAQEKLAVDFGKTVDDIINHEDRLLASHVEFATQLVNSYEQAAANAQAAVNALPKANAGAEGPLPEGEARPASAPEAPRPQARVSNTANARGALASSPPTNPLDPKQVAQAPIENHFHIYNQLDWEDAAYRITEIQKRKGWS